MNEKYFFRSNQWGVKLFFDKRDFVCQFVLRVQLALGDPSRLQKRRPRRPRPLFPRAPKKKEAPARCTIALVTERVLSSSKHGAECNAATAAAGMIDILLLNLVCSALSYATPLLPPTFNLFARFALAPLFFKHSVYFRWGRCSLRSHACRVRGGYVGTLLPSISKQRSRADQTCALAIALTLFGARALCFAKDCFCLSTRSPRQHSRKRYAVRLVGNWDNY